MKAEVLALVDELKRLKASGVSRVSVSEDAIHALKKAARGKVPTREEVLESIPEKVRSATASEFGKLVVEAKSPAAVVARKKASDVVRFAKPPVVSLPDGDKQTRWDALRDIVLNCREGAKHVKPDTKIVFGAGSLDADIFFVGEAPGAEEEKSGEPFQGDSGTLLGKMISAMGLKREDVYLANVMNWRPEAATAAGKRQPTAEEMAFCMPYLRAQLDVVKPKLIVALGVPAAKALLGADAFKNLRDVKGQWQAFEGTPVMPTYHPSYLLRNSSNRDKRAAWEDWLKVMEKVGMEISDRQNRYFL